MRKIILTTLICLSVYGVYGQKKTQVVAPAPDCLLVYNVAYSEFDRQFRNDIRGCAMGIIMTYIDGVSPSDIVGSLWNVDCGYAALDRFYTNIDLAADSFAACSGIFVTP